MKGVVTSSVLERFRQFQLPFQYSQIKKIYNNKIKVTSTWWVAQVLLFEPGGVEDLHSYLCPPPYAAALYACFM